MKIHFIYHSRLFFEVLIAGESPHIMAIDMVGEDFEDIKTDFQQAFEKSS